MAKLLVGDRAISALLRRNPFEGVPPRFVRAHVYRYAFTDRAERRTSGAWWKRTFVDELLPPIGLTPPPAEKHPESGPPMSIEGG